MRDMMQLTTEANAAALDAKMNLQITAQENRVRATAGEIQRRLRNLGTLVEDLRSDVAVALDLNSNAPMHPHGALGRDADSLDDLFRALANEIEALAGLRSARDAGKRLTDEFGARFAEVEPPQQTGAPTPEMAGQYL